MTTKVYRAGLIPYHYSDDGEVRYMFMKPSDTTYSGDCFQMAKGKIEDEDEDARDAAIREAKEELGLREENVVNIFQLGNFLGRTTVYMAEVKSMDDSEFDDFHHETQAVAWMTLDEFMDSGRELHHEIMIIASMSLPPSAIH